ncbi:MAG TPA: FoF1 ATP synthase subunit gamma [Candidatus Saccharimonadales bacterium]|nr:FoF1 ATP synthase subunit gamma [Candidatus Saccharimonadales bacterium]
MTIEELKKQIESTTQLESIAQAFEQSAALYIFKTKNKILQSQKFFEQAWKTYGIVKHLSYEKKAINKRRLIAIITPNQGMYGSLMLRLIEKAEELLKNQGSDLMVIGKKGKSHFSQNQSRSINFFLLPDEIDFQHISPIVDSMSKYGHISLVYPKYLSVFEQSVSVATIGDEDQKDSDKNHRQDIEVQRYSFDPGQLAITEYFSRAIFGVIIFGYFSESMLAYKAAQMIAMKKAYDNTKKQLEEERFQYSRLRRELIDSHMRELVAARMMWEGS